MYDIERLYEANTVREAIDYLERDKDALIIAGGSDVLIKIRSGKLAGCSLVSIHGIDELRGVKELPDKTISIGALTSFSHVANDPVIKRHIPILAHAVEQVGGPQIRNIGTIGGNVSNGVTSADSAATLLALDAKLVIEGPDGERIVSAEENYVSAGKVAYGHSDVLKYILISPEAYENHFGHYIKYSMRKAMDIATLGCAAVVELSRDKKTIVDAKLAYGVAAPIPTRCREAEKAIIGKEVCAETIRLFASEATKCVSPRTSWRASSHFRLYLVEELAARAMTKSIELAGGELNG
ncbi:MAG: xanthine dehydrogenase FAD-binding subunit XdhB [Clostridia bacterium]|nr:xanthine dehydrogenase FAD-binding subunit XdhB [Clostridia bacterium]